MCTGPKTRYTTVAARCRRSGVLLDGILFVATGHSLKTRLRQRKGAAWRASLSEGQDRRVGLRRRRRMMSDGRVHGRKHAAVQHGCWSTRDLDKDSRVQKYILANKSASALREVVHTSSEANIGATRN